MVSYMHHVIWMSSTGTSSLYAEKTSIAPVWWIPKMSGVLHAETFCSECSKGCPILLIAYTLLLRYVYNSPERNIKREELSFDLFDIYSTLLVSLAQKSRLLKMKQSILRARGVLRIRHWIVNSVHIPVSFCYILSVCSVLPFPSRSIYRIFSFWQLFMLAWTAGRLWLLKRK